MATGAELNGYADLERQLQEERDRVALLHQASATAARRAHELVGALAVERLRAEQLAQELAEADAPMFAQPRPAESVSDRPCWTAQAQHELTSALSISPDWGAGLKNAVKVIGLRGNWDAVSVWSADPRRPVLRCSAMWAGRGELTGFETATWQRSLPLSSSEHGRALNAPVACSLTALELTTDERLRTAAMQGMRSALLAPIRSGSLTVALLELLSRADQPPDAELTVAIEAVALQLGHFRQLLALAAAPRWQLGKL